MDTGDIATLLVAATGAGWVDAVVGGGGLILIPAIFLTTPNIPSAVALGTNKLTAITGTLTAAVTYARRTTLNWRVAGPAAVLAAVAAGTGAALATRLPANAFKPVILGVLVAVAIFVTFKPQLGTVEHPERATPTRTVAAVAVAGGVIGCYDGLVGPGTGTFLILTFTTVIGVDFVHGSAMAKIVNVGTNLGALVVFGLGGDVWWTAGAAMAVCNVIGAAVGARMALKRGAGFVRIVLLVVVLALVARLTYDLWPR